MKKYFTILLFAALLTSCSKNLSKTGLVGKWKLTESLMDPGDGSGQWTSPSEKTIIEFTNSGLIKYENKQSDNYKVTSDSTMELLSGSSSTINYRYKVDVDKLYMRPPCIEACGEKYERVK
ncbi:MAG: lipoprotein [Ginsengibacter sp.]